ncbi:hypothetical protein FIV42_22485 [Persicimonas caeni]|uniref:Uncharacterized protein n=1 Tax=Persicimonas caeni TaxID=2292766 RepID=A0A4Y6PZ16_PERCE|nr:hypothetical protein [Persicimonas caeni]QDG53409.1 hypothetical protein FIV42_22485 [Persicimonas caeni]QED34630.1 hypothetical protein FRD00_22480 [Persicimonas caeni]
MKWLDDDIVVWSYRKAKKCRACGRTFEGRRSLVVFQGKKTSKPTCINCMRLDALAFLPAGNAKLTRRASKYSSVRAVVVRHRRKYVERFGILVEPEAVFRACDECEVPVPEGSQEPIAGTPTALPPRIMLASRDEDYDPDTARTRQVLGDENEVKPHRSRGSYDTGADDITAIAELICQAFPGRSRRRARNIARFGLRHGVLRSAPTAVLTAADVGPLVSKYLRRHQAQACEAERLSQTT